MAKTNLTTKQACELIDIARSIRATGDLLQNLPETHLLGDDALHDIGGGLEYLTTRALEILGWEGGAEPQPPAQGGAA